VPIDTSLLAAQSFTSQAELEGLLSTLGVDLRTADDLADVVPLSVSFGSSRVLMKVARQATPAQLAASPWVRMAATIAAAVVLTSHGGEPVPASIASLWEEVQKDLDEVHAGTATVPDLVLPGDYGTGPVVIIPRVDLQKGRIVRRVAMSSTDTPAGYNVPTDYVGLWRSWGWWT
jgi:hypothetical protein